MSERKQRTVSDRSSGFEERGLSRREYYGVDRRGGERRGERTVKVGKKVAGGPLLLSVS